MSDHEWCVFTRRTDERRWRRHVPGYATKAEADATAERLRATGGLAWLVAVSLHVHGKKPKVSA